jgi:hypothetical protein
MVDQPAAKDYNNENKPTDIFEFFDESKKRNREKIILNARGIKYEILLDVLEKLPKSRLGKLKTAIDEIKSSNYENDVDLIKLCDDFDLKKSEYYFNKDPYVLNLILNLYSNDRLHILNDCTFFYGEEFAYWGIDEKMIESCCQFKYLDKKEEINEEIKIEKMEKNEVFNDKIENLSQKKFSTVIRKKIWNLLEKPSSSYFARVGIL